VEQYVRSGRELLISLSADDAADCLRDSEKGGALVRELIEKCYSQMLGGPKSSALIAVSLDSLASTVELFGSVVIEPMITNFAAKLRETLRVSDVVARLCEDQIGIVLPYLRSSGAIAATRRIHALQSKSVHTPFGAVDLTFSVASVLFPDEGLTPSDVIKRAQSTLAYRRHHPEQPLELSHQLRQTLRHLRSA
jgi:diguanylate cyclase (GGDEF)-like protein